MWAGRESYLSLVDGTCTHIRPRVQPSSIARLGWLAYVRTGYRDSANNESHYSSASLTPNTNSLISKSDRIAHRSDRPPTFYSSESLTPNTNNFISKSDRRIFPQEP